MEKFTYSITINKPASDVFSVMTDKSLYSDWAKAWGEGMTYTGEWKEGETVVFHDQTQGGTKAIVEEIRPGEYVRFKHIAMVDLQNNELAPTDENMKKWIGSLEEYYFKKVDDTTTELEVVMTMDNAFKEMSEGSWPKALQLVKELCEN